MDLEVDARSDVTVRRARLWKSHLPRRDAKGEYAGYRRILNLTLLVNVPPGVVTTTLSVVAPLGWAVSLCQRDLSGKK